MTDGTSSDSTTTSTNPLIRLSKSDLLARYRQRIKYARKFRQTEGLDDTWRRCIDLYRGKHFDDSMTRTDRIAVNIAFATVNTILPSISVNYPSITVAARKAEDDDRAAITEALVNYWWRHYEFKPEFQKAVKDFLIMGHGWLKVGYRFHEATEPLHPTDQLDMHQKLAQQADEFAQNNPELASSLPTDADIAASLPTERTVVKEDRPFVERVSPFHIYVDPEATCMEDAKWIAQKVYRDYDAVVRDKRFSAKARKAIQPDSYINFRDEDERDPSPSVRRAVGDDVKRVCLWEFYDLERNTMSIFSEKGEEYLIEPMALPYSYGMPFVMVRNYDVPDLFYPIGELEQIEPLQHELNMTRSAQLNDRKKFGRKYLYRRSLFSAQGLNALASDVDNTLVPVEDDTTPLNEVVIPLQQIAVDAQMYQLSDQIEADFDRVTGVNEYMRGAPPTMRRTATEAEMIDSAAQSRAQDKLATVEDSIREVAQRIIQLAQQYLTSEQAIKVVGTYGRAFVKVSPEDIQGEFDFSVEAGSTQPVNDTFRRQQAISMMQAVGPFMGFLLDPSQVLMYVLEYGFNIKNPQKLLLESPLPRIPTQRIAETINYKDAPPDIQRQIEAQAGLQPSMIPPGMEPQVEEAAALGEGATAQQAQVLAYQQGPRPVNYKENPPAAKTPAPPIQGPHVVGNFPTQGGNPPKALVDLAAHFGFLVTPQGQSGG